MAVEDIELQTLFRITTLDAPDLAGWRFVHVSASSRPHPVEVLGQVWLERHNDWLEQCSWNELCCDPRGVHPGVIEIAPATYCQQQATKEFADSGDRNGGPFATLVDSLPASIWSDIIVMDNDGRVLVMERSEKVAANPGAVFACLGEGSSFELDETLSDIATRCLDEELGLPEEEQKDCAVVRGVRLERFGDGLRAFFVVQLDLSEAEILARHDKAEDNWETREMWLVEPSQLHTVDQLHPADATAETLQILGLL